MENNNEQVTTPEQEPVTPVEVTTPNEPNEPNETTPEEKVEAPIQEEEKVEEVEAPEPELYYESEIIAQVESLPNEMVNVIFKSGRSKQIMLWELNAVSTPHPSDASEGRNARAIVVVDALYELLKGLNVDTNEISYIAQKLMGKMQGVEAKAIMNAFGKSEEDITRIGDWEAKL